MTSASDSAVSVAVLGTGIMGSAMARNLVNSGIRTALWDRSPAVTAALGVSGAQPAQTPADAVHDASVVITMLPTEDVVTSVMLGGGALEALPANAVWAQMGTIGVTATDNLAERVSKVRPDVMFVDAPVSGSKGPAETGRLRILASGPAAAEKVVRPVFAAPF